VLDFKKLFVKRAIYLLNEKEDILKEISDSKTKSDNKHYNIFKEEKLNPKEYAMRLSKLY
jgi:hypothetical protein